MSRYFWEDVWGWVRWPLLIVIVLFGIVRCVQWDNQRPETIAYHAAQAAQEAANRKPHVIREADGCKVYAFTADGRTHFFTRCPDSRTSTESSWTERHGKSHVTKTEVIDN